jgi:hypothetical protein
VRALLAKHEEAWSDRHPECFYLEDQKGELQKAIASAKQALVIQEEKAKVARAEAEAEAARRKVEEEAAIARKKFLDEIDAACKQAEAWEKDWNREKNLEALRYSIGQRYAHVHGVL